jgi:signal transduction histidine kinase
MLNWSLKNTGRGVLLLRLEAILIRLSLLLSAILGLSGLLLYGRALLIPLVLLLTAAFLYNFVLFWLKQRGGVDWVVACGAHLGNLVFLTISVYYTGGFSSPFFALYAAYIIIGGLNHGWLGTARSFSLCFLSWVILAVLIPPANLEEWGQMAVLVGAFLALSLVVGALAERYVGFFEQALQRNREIAFLNEAGRSLGASLEPQQVLAVTLAQVNEILDVEAASLALVDRETQHITFELAIGGGNDAVRGLRLEPGQGIVGRVIEEGRAELVPDVTADQRWYSGVDQISGYETQSLICVPLRVKGQAVGALEVLNKRDGPFTEEDQRLLASLADLAAQAIENARLHEQIRNHVQNLQLAYDEVRKLDELKSAFIRNVSHELRTPLTLIEGYTEMLLDGQLGPVKSEQHQVLSVMAQKSAHLNRMVNDIISLQTIGAMGFDQEILSLEDLTRGTVEQARPKAQKAGIILDLALLSSKDLLMVRGDARRLGQVIAHLLDNAIKFSPNGGTISVKLERQGEMVLIRVCDEGIGLPTDELERVFDRFYQVDGSATRYYGGTGLGLALVKEVAEAHGGAVRAESDGVPGQGCIFTIFLPALGQTAASW